MLADLDLLLTPVFETRPARFELATFRSGGALVREGFWGESSLDAEDSLTRP